MWLELIQKYTANCIFYPPASEKLLNHVEEALGVSLPDSLQGLLFETDGLSIRPSFIEWDKPSDYTGFIYSVQEIVKTNLELRSVQCKEEFEPLQSILFFASEPSGDFLGFPVVAGRADASAVISMSHDDYTERSRVAGSLQEMVTTFLHFVQRMEAEENSPPRASQASGCE